MTWYLLPSMVETHKYKRSPFMRLLAGGGFQPLNVNTLRHWGPCGGVVWDGDSVAWNGIEVAWSVVTVVMWWEVVVVMRGSSGGGRQ